MSKREPCQSELRQKVMESSDAIYESRRTRKVWCFQLKCPSGITHTLAYIHKHTHTYALFSKCGLGTYKRAYKSRFCLQAPQLNATQVLYSFCLAVCVSHSVHTHFCMLHFQIQFVLIYLYVIVLHLSLPYFKNCNQELESDTI